MTKRIIMRNLPFFRSIGLAALAVLTTFAARPAWAASPTVVIASASLVSPSAALTYYGTPTSPTPPATRDKLVQEMARSLRYNVDNIYANVRDNVEYLPMFGLQKGARGVILDGYGTDFDQAQFMVDLLRESDAVASTGYNPVYKMGQITVTASDFAAWTGVSDAAIATKLLANGGIPATVTGSGMSFTVVMLHVWVQVTIGGSNYLFDPSFKASTPITGLNWQASSSYSQSTLLTAGGGGTGTTISGFNIPAFRSQLDTYRGNIESFIAANAAGKRANVVVGDTQITAHPSSEDRRTSLPYAAAPDRSWSGQIPDAYRTAFTVTLNATSYGPYFADEVGGTVLGFGYSQSGSTFVGTGTLPYPVVAGSFLNECDNYQSNRSSIATPAVASVIINHPYAASGGAYADRTISRQLAQQQCASGLFYVSNDWGYTGTGVTQRIAPQAAFVRLDPTRPLDIVFAPTVASVASQYSAFLDLASRAQGASYQVHDLVGIHTLDNVSLSLVPPGNADLATVLSMDFEAAVSAMSNGGTTAGDVSAAYTASLALTYAEGAVPRQETDSVYDLAAVNLFTQQDTRATTPGTYSTYLATPSTWSTVQGSLSAYPAAATTAMSTYVGEGYSLLAPQKGALRQPPITVASVVTRTSSVLEGVGVGSTPAEVARSAFLAWRPSGGAGSPPDRVAMVIYDQRRGSIVKAGVGVPIATGTNNDPIRKPETPKAESKDIIRAALNIDPRSGAVTYAPAADLTDGSGDFPRSLSLQRVYDERDPTNYGFGMGWKSNWYQVATLSNDGQAALGRADAQAIGSILTAVQAMSDLVTAQDAQHLYAALQVAAWLGDQTINNSIVVTRGLDGEQSFYKQASGVYVAAKPDGATITLTGSPTVGIVNRWLYLEFSVNYTDSTGTVRAYTSGENLAGRDLSSPGIASLFTRKSQYMTDWTFPNGIKVWTAYNGSVAAPDILFLYRVYNNLGNAIYNNAYDFGSQTTVPTCRTPGGLVVYDPPYSAVIAYKTPSSAEARFNMDGQIGWTLNGDPDNAHCPAGSTTPSRTQHAYMSNLNSKLDPAGNTWSYAYTGTSGMFGTVNSLGTIYRPGSASPDITITFGVDNNARSLTNLRSNSWQYYASAYRSEVVTPVQAAGSGQGSAAYFDRYAQPIRAVDPLSRTTLTSYDDLGRPILVTRPEGNSTAIAYDVRGNAVQQTQHAKPGSGLSDIVTSTSYMEGATVVVCSNIKTCNKPAYTIDGNGYRTKYGWDSSSAELTSVSAGWDGATGLTCQVAGGTCPLTSFTYTGTAGFDPYAGTTSTIQLPTGKTETISSGVIRTTTYGYTQKTFSSTYTPMSVNTVQKIQAKEIVVDSGGLALRTCYSSDISGSPISQTEPRAALGSCP